jgi:membrane-associated phospholipid phosphatase
MKREAAAAFQAGRLARFSAGIIDEKGTGHPLEHGENLCMSQTAQRKSIWRRSIHLFGRLLALWSDHRRLIMLAAITAALLSFLGSLAAETRRSLLTGLLAQRDLIILLLVFNLLALSLLWSAGQRLDIWIFLLLNLRGHHPQWLDRLMWALTQIGNGAVGILLGIFFYFVGERRFAVELLLGILSLWLAVELTKAIIERSRPFLALENTRVIGWRERGKSFPSGHTSQAFFMMTLFTQHFNPGALVSGALFVVALLVGLTRVYVGAHYPRDVLGGAILGSVWGILSGLIEVYLSTGQF